MAMVLNAVCRVWRPTWHGLVAGDLREGNVKHAGRLPALRGKRLRPESSRAPRAAAVHGAHGNGVGGELAYDCARCLLRRCKKDGRKAGGLKHPPLQRLRKNLYTPGRPVDFYS